jgi:GT2 family glycosyltransferase
MLDSLQVSTVKLTSVHIIDNGQNDLALRAALANVSSFVSGSTRIFTPKTPLGVAESWNWFIRNVSEERLIVNDDLIFAPTSLERLLASSAALTFAAGCGFSCFLLRDECVNTIGLFDETISPGYGYYEDEDYLQRINGRGTRPGLVDMADVACDVTHLRSQTLATFTPIEMQNHHRRFLIAQRNYMRKYGLTSL